MMQLNHTYQRGCCVQERDIDAVMVDINSVFFVVIKPHKQYNPMNALV